MALELRISSPVCSSVITYEWPLKKSKDYDAAAEIVETVKFVCRDYVDLERLTEQRWFKEVDPTDFASLKSFCDSYNKAVSSMKSLLKGTTKLEQKLNEWASPEALHQIIQQVYNRSVTDPDRLNQYEPFSPEVYGETSYDLIKKMIDETRPTENDIFLDLGSGVGQVVLQVAAGSKCRECYGIERAETPSEFAKTMDEEFRKWMKWYGKKYNQFELIKGDFLDNSAKPLIQKATIIFVNNYAFGPSVDHQLKLNFAELQDGVRIISSKPFCPLNFRITDRNLTDIGCVMRVKELTPHKGNVSWTCNGVTYYLHTVDRTLLQQYYDEKSEQMKNEDLRRCRSNGGSSKSSSNDSSESNSRESSVSKIPPIFDDEETIPMGPTTRRQWNEWIAKKDQRPSKEPVPGQKPLKESARMQSPPAQKSHSTASIRSSSRGSANSDHIVSQPSVPSVKAKSSVTSSSDTSTSERRKPGRPKNKSRTEIHATATKRKYQLQTKNKVGRPSVGTTTTAPTKQQDYMSALDMLHQQTLFTSSQMYEGPPKGCSDVNLSSLKSPVVPAVQSSPEQRDIDALETYLANHRSLMVAFMRQFRMPEYRQYLMECCEKEVAKNKNLLLRQEQLSRQINHLQEEGLDLLKCRISDLGLFATSPAELLNKAKEIVLHHKELQNKVNQLQGEVNGLEQQNQMYVNCIEEKDKEILQNGMLQSLGYPESQSAKETKENILREISSALTHKRALLHECVRMETEISAIVANIPPDRALEVILANRQIHMEAATTITSPIAQTFGVTSTGENFMSSTPVTSGVPLKIESPNVFTFANATTSTTPTTTTPAVTTTSKRGRQNSGKTGRSPRRSKATPAPVRLGEGSQVTGSDGAACQNTDEIEEKIRDIVRKALSVDSAAKSAEKERRAARNAERRKEKSARGFRAGGAGRPIEPRDGEAHRGSMHDSSMVNNSINSIVSAIASNSAIDMTAVEVRNMSQPPSAVVTSSSTLINTAAVATFSGAGLVPVFPQELPSSSASPMENRPSQPTALTQPEMSVSRGSSEDTESASETETTNDSSKDFSMIQPKEDDTGAKDTGELSVCDSSETDEPKNLVIDEPMDTQPSIVNKLYISTSADKLQSVRLCSDVVISRPSSVPVLSGVTREFSIANIISTSSDTASAIYPPRVASVPGTVGSTDFSQTKSPAIIAKTTTPVLPVSTVVSNFLGFTQSDVSCLSPSSSGNSLFGTNSAVNTSVADTMIADSRNSDSGEYGKMEDEPEVFKVSSYLSEGRQESSEPFAFGRGETPTPIANVSLFKGSSNTGQPGSPHEYSNPGNPSGQQIPDFTPAKESIEEENLFKGSSNDGCAGHPHKHSNPGNPSIKDEVLRVESTTKHVVQPSESTSESEDPKPLKIEEKSEAEMEKTAVVGVEVKQEIPSTPTKEDTVVKKEKILPLMSQTVADLFGGEVTSGLPKLQNFRIPRATKRPSSPKIPQELLGTHSPLSHNLVAKQEPGWNSCNVNEKSAESNRRRSTRIDGPPQKRYRSECDDSSMKSPRQLGHGAYGDRPKSFLTRDSLEKHSARSDLHTFSERGLMETLLEHKMRTGRVESHTKLVDRSFVNHPPLSQQQSGPPDPLAIDFDPEEPSNSKRPKSPPKGPRTPPGTPPKCTPSPNLHRSGSKDKRKMEVSEASDSGAKEPSAEPSSSECPPAIAGVIDSLAHAAKVDSNQLKKIFTNELIQKLQSLEPAVLMLTLTTLLTTMAQSSAENRSETDGGDDNTTETQKGSGRKRRKTDRSDSESKEVAQRRMLGSSIGGSEDQQVTSTTAGVYENKIPVEMDIDDSDDGVSVDSRQSSVTGRRVCVSSGSSEANSRDKKPAAYDNSPFPPLPPESESFCPQYPMGDGSEMAFTHGHQYNPPAPVPPPQPVFNVKQRRDFASEVIFAPQDVSGGHPRFSDPFHPTVESTQLFQPPQQPQMFQSGNFCQNPTLSLESIISTLPAAIGGQLKGLMDTPIANPFGAGFQPTMGTSAPPAIDTATHNALAQLLGQAVRNLNVAVNNEIRSRVPPMDVVGMNFRPQSAPIRAPHPQPEIGVGYSPNQPRPLFRRDNYAPSPQEYYGGNPMIAAPHGGNFPQESFGGHVQPPRFRRPPPSHQPDYHHPDGFYHPDHPRFSRPFQRPGGPSRGQPQFYPRPTGFPRRFPPPQYQDYQEEYDWEEEESAGPYLPWEQPPVRQNFPGRFQRRGYHQNRY